MGEERAAGSDKSAEEFEADPSMEREDPRHAAGPIALSAVPTYAQNSRKPQSGKATPPGVLALRSRNPPIPATRTTADFETSQPEKSPSSDDTISKTSHGHFETLGTGIPANTLRYSTD